MNYRTLAKHTPLASINKSIHSIDAVFTCIIDLGWI